MPRCHIRCNVITDPDQSARNRLHCDDIVPYLQCFYHVPVKVVYEVLGMSHHTLAPIRRRWNLRRWPFADICRGAFMLDGMYMTWDDVDRKRKDAMQLPTIDPRIKKILEVMGERARHHMHKVNWVIARQRKEQQKTTMLAMAAREPKPVQPAPLPMFDESLIPSDTEWLETFSNLLAAELDAAPGELFPPIIVYE